MTNYLVVRANMLVFGALAALLLLVGGLTWERLTANRVARQLVQHTNAVIENIKDLNIAVHDAETGQQGYLLTGADDYLAPYESALDKVGFLQGELQRLTSDDREKLVGIISRTGTIFMADDDGTDYATLLGPDRMEICHLRGAPETRLASCAEFTHQP